MTHVSVKEVVACPFILTHSSHRASEQQTACQKSHTYCQVALMSNYTVLALHSSTLRRRSVLITCFDPRNVITNSILVIWLTVRECSGGVGDGDHQLILRTCIRNLQRIGAPRYSNSPLDELQKSLLIAIQSTQVDFLLA